MQDSQSNATGNGFKISTKFPPAARLRKKHEFDRVFRNATRLTCSSATLLVTENDLGHPRLGLAISKKYAKSAVSRNLIKRVIRDSFRHHQEAIGAFDIVVLAKPGITRLSSKELRHQIDQLWSRITRKCDN